MLLLLCTAFCITVPVYGAKSTYSGVGPVRLYGELCQVRFVKVAKPREQQRRRRREANKSVYLNFSVCTCNIIFIIGTVPFLLCV
jgi:hypothetical protein